MDRKLWKSEEKLVQLDFRQILMITTGGNSKIHWIGGRVQMLRDGMSCTRA